MRPTPLLGVILIACSPPPPQSVPVTRDTVVVEMQPPVTDLSGGWATGSANEPPAGPVRPHPSCAYNPPVWIIQQKGNALETWAFPESYNQGIARVEPMQKTPAIRGTISGADVRIGDADVRLILRYDETSGHLRGTRNGAPFWAARQIIVRDPCPGIPDA